MNTYRKDIYPDMIPNSSACSERIGIECIGPEPRLSIHFLRHLRYTFCEYISYIIPVGAAVK